MINPEFSPTAYRMRGPRLKLEIEHGICPHCGAKDIMGKPYCYGCQQFKDRPAQEVKNTPAENAEKHSVNGNNGHHAESVRVPVTKNAAK